MLDEMCARYTVQRANRRWTTAMFYGMINIAAVKALVIHANNMYKDQPEKEIKRKDFLLRIAHDLVKPFVTERYKLPTLSRNIKTAILMCGFVSESEENAMQGPEDYEAVLRKRGHCHVCSRNRNVKTQFVCKGRGHYVCKDHMSMIVTCEACRNKGESSSSSSSSYITVLHYPKSTQLLDGATTVSGVPIWPPAHKASATALYP